MIYQLSKLIMSKPKILYSCGFEVGGHAGKNRATMQKLQALAKLSNLAIIDLKSKSMAIKPFSLIFTEFKNCFFIITNKPDVYISRGFVGFISLYLAKFLAITTVREIHANALNEVSQLNKSQFSKFLLILLSKLTHKIDLSADIRIFNHPQLLKWFKDNFHSYVNDGYVYNGFDYGARSKLTYEQARSKFKFDPNDLICVFTGSASKWHGTDYLLSVAKELSERKLPIKIVCGGGKISLADNIENFINIAPLDPMGCADLIAAADICLLPVLDSRTSPGSPLKLYDYILAKKFVLTQINTLGYSDEVLAYGNGLLTDFTNTLEVANLLSGFNRAIDQSISEIDISRFSWDSRMREWLNLIFNPSSK